MVCSLCKEDKDISEFVYRKDRQKHVSNCKSCKANIDKQWSLSNKDKRRLSKTKCDRKLRSTKISTKLKDGLRTRLNTAIRNRMYRGYVSHIRDLGCSIDELILYIESKFQPGMSWGNRGNGPGTWQIDHIKPFCKASNLDEIKQCIHFTNLQPLWWCDHVVKSLTDTATLD